MRSFCAEAPTGTTYSSRECIIDNSHNPDNISINSWLASDASLDATQQLSLDTVVGQSYATTLGLYRPDLPNAGCQNYCNFLISVTTSSILNETISAALQRHLDRYSNFPGYTSDFPLAAVSHVLRQEERDGKIVAQTWITFVFQKPQ